MKINRIALLALCGGVWAGGASATEPPLETPRPSMERIVPSSPPKGLGHKILLYLPNRVLDLLDIFRVRVRVGPGLGVSARITDYTDTYIGAYHTAYVGLPGPRMEPILPPVVGRESLKGIKLLGVNATDDSPHPPNYSPTECAMGAQALLVGVDLGVDPVEFGDFLAGFILMDIRGDDR